MLINERCDLISMTQVHSDRFRHEWAERRKASWDNSALVLNPALLSFLLSATVPHMVSVSHRFAPALSLAWTFLYLLFFRLSTWFGLPAPTPFANAIQLLLTLKVEELNGGETTAAHGDMTDLLFVARWWVWPTRCKASTWKRRRTWALLGSLLPSGACHRSRPSTTSCPIATVTLV